MRVRDCRLEERELSLKKMLKTVTDDRQKILQTIDTLDALKLDALVKTWKHVNEYASSHLMRAYRDFGMIFEELLPGASCRLDLLDRDSIGAGLEVKVALGGIWKASLTELSGGQRSVVALALILALLQASPAPFYILDEVDAALDLSHTQNIGKILRSERFAASQFIVVSLKEGMFDNANVLYRTQYRDGVSSVECTVNGAGKNAVEGGANILRKKIASRLAVKSHAIEEIA